jgi:cellulose synthase/poly-beta-1,6-N-acetylglucosamine synthase-like glycosyltransferase/spore germination protein YaaH/peptidoglycan/xylan/chitin deacetylase (PgdA/CDA1 family)
MDKQIFQTSSKSRWKRFKWTIRIVLLVIALFVAVFVTMLFIDRSPSFPFKDSFRSALTADKPFMRQNKIAKEYKGFRSFFHQRKASSNYAKWKNVRMKRMLRFHDRADKNTAKYINSWTSQPAGIRSAFYVNWDPQSYASLKAGISKLNLILPEWIHINPSTAKMEVKMDGKGYNLMKKSGIPVMPMLSNAYNGEFTAKGIEKILHSKSRRKALIDSTLNLCLKNKFVGINLDLEELSDNDNSYLTSFVKEVSEVFHAHGLYVTQDVSPFNEDYDVKELAKYDDFLFLMAYDEHNTMSDPGDISSQQWIEKAVDQLAAVIPEEKIVLCMAAYGYDWTARGDNNQSLSYHDALSLAADSYDHIAYDEDTYGLSYAYIDDDGVNHQVYFNDAATNFNTMRFGADYGLAGFSVWRLGTEDNRLWQFYGRDMTHKAAARMAVGDLEKLQGSRMANYIGDGEVLDLIHTPHGGSCSLTMDNEDILIADEDYTRIPTAYELQKFGSAKKKQLLLTFDDGPDSRWTPKILSILKKYHVKASFFMVGLQIEKNLPIVKDVYEGGHMIGNHTFTHHNVAENSPDRTYMELRLTRLLIESITGNSTILFRAPYNADSDPSGAEELIPLVEARRQNYLDVGESIDPEDWEPGITADQIFQRVIKGVEQGNGHIILLHDAGGDTRKETVKALPRIIEYLQQHGYTFISLPQYLDKSPRQLMPSIPKGKEYYAMQANLTLAEAFYHVGNFISALFIVFLVLGIGRLLFMLVLVIMERKRNRELPHDMPAQAPLVSIIVPAYNEEVNAVNTLRNLLKQDYPNFNIIFVDDGSKDATFQRVTDAFKDHPQMLLLTKENGGKASALNYGISHTDAEYVVCIDADTQLYHDAITFMMRHFFADTTGRVGAVAGNVKVGNRMNMLTNWQAIEYTTSQNFDRQAYSAINAITVVPGAIGCFRRSAILDAGGLTTDTLAEDCDLTIRILKKGYLIENENHAVAMTEAPEKLRQFMKQRTRWSFGVMQTFWKHRNAMFLKRYKGLGLWALPNMLVFQFLIPTFSPIADVLMIVGLFSGNIVKVLLYYLIFLLVDGSISIMAYLYEHDRLWTLLWIIPQRLCYRWIMYIVLFRSYKKAIKGELQQWGVLKRTGKVKNI